jgi:hypothetical protein
LRERGRERATRWLDGPGRHVGQASTVDLGRLFAMPPRGATTGRRWN